MNLTGPKKTLAVKKACPSSTLCSIARGELVSLAFKR